MRAGNGGQTKSDTKERERGEKRRDGRTRRGRMRGNRLRRGWTQGKRRIHERRRMKMGRIGVGMGGLIER